MTTRQYKQFKGLKTESLRDNMTNLELVLNMLAEASTPEISKQKNPAPPPKTGKWLPKVALSPPHAKPSKQEPESGSCRD